MAKSCQPPRRRPPTKFKNPAHEDRPAFGISKIKISEAELIAVRSEYVKGSKKTVQNVPEGEKKQVELTQDEYDTLKELRNVTDEKISASRGHRSEDLWKMAVSKVSKSYKKTIIKKGAKATEMASKKST